MRGPAPSAGDIGVAAPRVDGKMNDPPAYRPANAADSRFIAEMIDRSSDGIAFIEWTAAAQAAGNRTAP
jgi:hypothetical protein